MRYCLFLYLLYLTFVYCPPQTALESEFSAPIATPATSNGNVASESGDNIEYIMPEENPGIPVAPSYIPPYGGIQALGGVPVYETAPTFGNVPVMVGMGAGGVPVYEYPATATAPVTFVEYAPTQQGGQVIYEELPPSTSTSTVDTTTAASSDTTTATTSSDVTAAATAPTLGQACDTQANPCASGYTCFVSPSSQTPTSYGYGYGYTSTGTAGVCVALVGVGAYCGGSSSLPSVCASPLYCQLPCNAGQYGVCQTEVPAPPSEVCRYGSFAQQYWDPTYAPWQTYVNYFNYQLPQPQAAASSSVEY